MSHDSERYFPQHKIEKDIGLAEYNFACARVGSTDESVSWATNTTALIATAATYAALEASKYKIELEVVGANGTTFKTIVLLAILLYSILAIVHLSYLHKSRVFASRKVIVLRRILGVSYGEQNLVLPNWRIEGADNPFAIKLFSGFFSYQSFPIHMVLFSAMVSIYLLGSSSVLPIISRFLSCENEQSSLFCIGAIWYGLGLFVYRWQLREVDENLFLWIALTFAFCLRVPTTSAVNTTLYGIKLDIAEAKRLHADFSCMDQFSVFIEDGEFFKHKGVNWKALLHKSHEGFIS